MTRALPFTQASAERAIKAARKQGLHVSGLTVHPDGSITISTGEPRAIPNSPSSSTPALRDAREKLGVA